MSLAVLIRRDAGGARPILVREGEQLETPRGVSWQFVASFASEADASDLLLRLLAQAAGPADEPPGHG